MTGHEDPEKPDSALDWPALAAFPGTLVFYMGVRALPRIAEQLIAGGRPADEPVAVVERGTLPEQRTLLATLADVAARAAAESIRAPAITLVGPVAGLREQIAWLERRPLHGRTIAVTRARPQGSALAARLRELGAAVVEAPAIRIRPIEAELPDLGRYDLICVTRRTGPTSCSAASRPRGSTPARLPAARWPRSGRAPRARWPSTASAPISCPSGRWPKDSSRRSRASTCAARSWCARARAARRCPTRCGRAAPRSTWSRSTRRSPRRSTTETARAAAQADYVTFTSASTVRFFLAAAGALDGPRIASIGPATSAALREAGLEPDLEADPHTPGRPRGGAPGRRRPL